MISKCLRESSNGAVLPYDTRDDKGRERFHPFTPGSHFNQRVENVTALKASGKKPGWFTSYSAWGLKTGYETQAPFPGHFPSADITSSQRTCTGWTRCCTGAGA